MSTTAQSLDDIVFENRNKSYGAYFLRQVYEKNIRIAAIIASTIFVLAIAGPLIYKLLKPKEEEIYRPKMVDVTKLEAPPIDPKSTPPPPPPPPPPPSIPPSVKYLPPVIAPDEEVTEEPPKVEELKEANPGEKTVEGDPNAEQAIVVEESGTGNAVVEEKPEEIFLVVEQQPEFPGGIQEMMKFIQKNVKYPAQAKNMGIEGKVFIQFVVNSMGDITGVTLVKGIGYGCDDEALRVVNIMPRWTPGKQNGKSVSVRYSIPISFKLAQ
ncbi:MAG: TonB family protein [Cytophagales bacterium]|nr:TonB family protein [Cytophagales bacterium]